MTVSDLKGFGNAIRQARKKRFLTIGQLSTKSDTDRATVSKMEKGLTKAKTDTIAKVIVALIKS